MVEVKIYHAICLVLFLSLQHSLFLSNNSLFTYFGLNDTLNTYSHNVYLLKANNEKINDEIERIKKNKSYLEVYARENFGYIKKNETFYQIIKNEK